MRRYEPEVREAMVQRMMSPENVCIATLARETGISRGTLQNWRKQAKATKGTPVPGNGKRPAAWSSEDKFLAVVATTSMNQVEVAEYCRSKGLYAQELQSWRRACIEGQEKMTLREDMKALKDALEKERKRTKEAERELLRKDRALAETAALLALRKKAQAIWGEDEDAI